MIGAAARHIDTADTRQAFKLSLHLHSIDVTAHLDRLACVQGGELGCRAIVGLCSGVVGKGAEPDGGWVGSTIDGFDGVLVPRHSFARGVEPADTHEVAHAKLSIDCRACLDNIDVRVLHMHSARGCIFNLQSHAHGALAVIRVDW